MAVLYDIDSRKLSYREYWRATDWVSDFLILALLKMLQVRTNVCGWYPRLEEVPLLGPDAVHPGLKRRVREVIAECVAHDLRLKFYYCEDPFRHPPRFFGRVLGGKEAAGQSSEAIQTTPRRRPAPGEPGGPAVRSAANAALVSGDARVFCAVEFDEHDWPQATLTCYSRLADGRILLTTELPDRSNWLARPPDVEAQALDYHRAFAEDVLELHYRRVAQAGAPAVPFDPDRLGSFLLELNHRIADYQVSRGAFVPVEQKVVSAMEALDQAGLI
jgi:hypothetical protein